MNIITRATLLLCVLTASLLFTGCSTRKPDTDVLYQRYRSQVPSTLDIVSYDLSYHGSIKVDSERYHFLGYSYKWEVLPGNIRGNGLILVFDHSEDYVGYFKVYGSPDITIAGKKMELYFPQETEHNQQTYFDFSQGFPTTDGNHFGFYFSPLEPSVTQNATDVPET